MPNASNPMWALILIVSHVLTEDKCYLWLFVVIPIMMLFYVLWLSVYWSVDGLVTFLCPAWSVYCCSFSVMLQHVLSVSMIWPSHFCVHNTYTISL